MIMPFFKSIVLLVCLCVVNAHKLKLDLEKVSVAVYSYNGVYMWSKADSPISLMSGDSSINVDVVVKKTISGQDINAYYDLAIVPEEVWSDIGYINKEGVQIVCCDSEARSSGICSNLGHLVIPKSHVPVVKYVSQLLTNEMTEINLQMEVVNSGIYYVVSTICSKPLQPLIVDGTVSTTNPFGYLNGNLIGNIPLFALLFAVFLVATIFYSWRMSQFKSEVLQVHYFIQTVLILFTINSLVKLLLNVYINMTDNDVYFFHIVSVVIDCLTRTATRALAVIVCMGYGISTHSLNGHERTLLIVSVVYFLFSCWDSIALIYPQQLTIVEKVRLVITSTLDAIIYYWVFHCLFDTISTLREAQQSLKLSVFLKLRRILLISLFCASATLGVFCIVLYMNITNKLWKYQWLINDGIWTLFYCALSLAVMNLWMPSEHSSAIAYHLQLSTNEKTTDEEYGIKADDLQDSTTNENHIIIQNVTSEFKPMVVDDVRKK